MDTIYESHYKYKAGSVFLFTHNNFGAAVMEKLKTISSDTKIVVREKKLSQFSSQNRAIPRCLHA